MKCHLCNGQLFPEPILQLPGMPKAAQYYPAKDEFKKDKGIILNIYQCSCCGLVQLNVKPVAYFKEVITAASLSEKSRQSRLQEIKRMVDKFNLKGKKGVDIGCCRGEMLPVLEEAGLKACGIEAGAESVATGKKAGRNIVKGYIGDKKSITGGPFDAFICLNFLEHLPSPGQIIGNIYNNTKTDAVGYITVPNLEYLLRTKCLYEFVADHLSYFTKKTLTYAFEANGFEVLECYLINEENDVAVMVKKKTRLDISGEYGEVEALISDLRRIIAEYRSKNKKVAVWGAGHRTLALLALSGATDIEYIIDSAKFKQGKFAPVTHLKIVSPDELKKNKVDLVIVMVPGLYPAEVCKTLDAMNLGVAKAMLRDNKIVFV